MPLLLCKPELLVGNNIYLKILDLLLSRKWSVFDIFMSGASCISFSILGYKIYHLKMKKMKKENNVVEYTFEASEFQWEIAPGKSITHGDLTSKYPDL
jgi:hypothetical protein